MDTTNTAYPPVDMSGTMFIPMPTDEGWLAKLKAKAKEIFTTLFAIDVSAYTEERKGLTYLSWAHALSETMKVYPDMSYRIQRFGPDKLPYLFDPKTGYMVFTEVTIDGITKEMWLPVLDTNNKAMLDHPYTYDTKTTKGIKVEAATMYEINKAIMRCLVKNLAVFGLGMYIYNKDDLPEAVAEANEAAEAELAEKIAAVRAKGSELISATKCKPADVRSIVAECNGGDGEPGNIPSIEIADAVIAAFEEKIATAKKPAEKKSTKKEKENA